MQNATAAAMNREPLNMTRLEPAPNEDEFDPHSLDNAADKTPIETKAPELSDQTEELVAWDEPPDASGHETPTVKPEDEIPPVEQLVEEGMDQAERDRRIAAEDPDFEP
jgi:hypothetical protein